MRLLFRCARTVSESYLLEPCGLLFERKQIPQNVVNVRNWRKPMETLETVILLHTQEVAGSSPVAPTNKRRSSCRVGSRVAPCEIQFQRQDRSPWWRFSMRF